MGGWINGLVPEQLPADERIRICELYVSAASLSQIFQCVVADWQRRFLAVVLSHLPVDRVVVGGRLRSWVSVPQNRLAEHSSVLRPHISVLGQLSVGVTGKSTSVLVSISGNRRCVSRGEKGANLTTNGHRSYCFGGFHDDLRLE